MSLNTNLQREQVGQSEIRKTRDYARARTTVVNEFMRSGRFDFTEADVDAAAQQQVAKQANANERVAVQGCFDFENPSAAPAAADRIAGPSAAKQPLRRISSAANSLASRGDAFDKTQRRGTSRRVAALAEFEAAGHRGLTRYELAQRLGCEQCSVTQTVRELVSSSQIVELSERRRSASGGEGCVLVLCLFAEGRS